MASPIQIRKKLYANLAQTFNLQSYQSQKSFLNINHKPVAPKYFFPEQSA